MDAQEYYDDKLTTLKAFNTYLSNIIDKGYNNDTDTLLLIVKHINNFVDEHTESNNESILPKELLPDDTDNNTLYFSNDSEKTNTDSELDTDSESDYEDIKNKELNKIKNFIENSDDLSKKYIYMKNNNYIKKMNRFITSSLVY